MKKIILNTMAALTLSAASSSAAVLMTIQDVGNDMVVTLSGSMDLTGAYEGDTVTGRSGSTAIFQSNGRVYGHDGIVTSSTVYEWFTIGQVAQSLLPAINFGSNIVDPAGGFVIDDRTGQRDLFLYGVNPTFLDNDLQEIFTWSPTTIMTMANASVNDYTWGGLYDSTNTYFSMGGTSTGDSFNVLVVSPPAVPEPSSVALLCLGSLGLLLRRKRAYGFRIDILTQRLHPGIAPGFFYVCPARIKRCLSLYIQCPFKSIIRSDAVLWLTYGDIQSFSGRNYALFHE